MSDPVLFSTGSAIVNTGGVLLFSGLASKYPPGGQRRVPAVERFHLFWRGLNWGDPDNWVEAWDVLHSREVCRYCGQDPYAPNGKLLHGCSHCGAPTWAFYAWLAKSLHSWSMAGVRGKAA